jgi:putative transposase
VSHQCELLELSRSSYYYEPATESKENLALMALIDREYTDHPFLGTRRMTTGCVAKGTRSIANGCSG